MTKKYTVPSLEDLKNYSVKTLVKKFRDLTQELFFLLFSPDRDIQKSLHEYKKNFDTIFPLIIYVLRKIPLNHIEITKFKDIIKENLYKKELNLINKTYPELKDFINEYSNQQRSPKEKAIYFWSLEQSVTFQIEIRIEYNKLDFDNFWRDFLVSTNDGTKMPIFSLNNLKIIKKILEKYKYQSLNESKKIVDFLIDLEENFQKLNFLFLNEDFKNKIDFAIKNSLQQILGSWVFLKAEERVSFFNQFVGAAEAVIKANSKEYLELGQQEKNNNMINNAKMVAAFLNPKIFYTLARDTNIESPFTGNEEKDSEVLDKLCAAQFAYKKNNNPVIQAAIRHEKNIEEKKQAARNKIENAKINKATKEKDRLEKIKNTIDGLKSHEGYELFKVSDLLIRHKIIKKNDGKIKDAPVDECDEYSINNAALYIIEELFEDKYSEHDRHGGPSKTDGSSIYKEEYKLTKNKSPLVISSQDFYPDSHDLKKNSVQKDANLGHYSDFGLLQSYSVASEEYEDMQPIGQGLLKSFQYN